jgi:hypothetical protein
MVINPTSAARFISGYKSLLSEIHRLAGEEHSERTLDMLAAARERISLNPPLIKEAAAALEAGGHSITPDVLSAIKTLHLRQWIFLRDTSRYSIFVDPKEHEAYGVLGLTDRIRDILGGSAAAFNAGIVEYCGRYVCDGIIANHVWLGPNYKKEFSSLFAKLKKNGRMYLLPQGGGVAHKQLE